MKTKLTYEKLNRQNLGRVLKIKHLLFPESKCDDDYQDFFTKSNQCCYYLVKCNNQDCAITGWYSFDKNKKDAFMGWFGVLPTFRNKGIGTNILLFTINDVNKKNFEYFRVYTDKVENYASCCLYDKTMDIRENYTFPDKLGKTGNFVIYTKFLNLERETWNNRPLNEDFNYNL